MFHIYQRPFSPKGQECASRILQASQSYDVRIVRSTEELQQVYKLAGRKVSLPRVFTSIGAASGVHHIGGLSKLRTWLESNAPMQHDEMELPPLVPQGNERWNRDISAQEALQAFNKTMRGHQMTLTMLDSSIKVATESDWRWIVKQCNEDIHEMRAPESPSLALYIAVMCSLKYGLNSCGIVMDASGEHIYNLVWLDTGFGDVDVRAYEPTTGQWVEMGSGNYRAAVGQVIIP